MTEVDSAEWSRRVWRATERAGTPCYVTAWAPIARALDRIHSIPSAVPVRSWLSFKTHPLPALADRWLRDGRGVEVVSESELVTVRQLGCRADQLLVNGVAKHAWLPRYPIPGLHVHFDSPRELDELLPTALSFGWRVGVRCHVPGESDARDPAFGGQFGMNRREAVAALRTLSESGAGVHSVHFHLGQAAQAPDAYSQAMKYVAGVCAEAGVRPRVLDCGGGLPSPDARLDGLATAIRLAPAHFEALEEIWLENGRFVTQQSTALAVRVLDIKEREECRYVICDGGRTNQALAADHHRHPLLVVPPREGAARLTTVCGPTCMTDDRLGRWHLPDGIAIGDVLVWLDAGAYHLPWETRFSHGLCAVAWYDDDEALCIVRERERPAADQGWERRYLMRHA